MPDLRKRKFTALRKRPMRPTEPVALQVEYLAELKGMLAQAHALVTSRVVARLPLLLAQAHMDAEREDANPMRRVVSLFNQISAAFFKRWPQARLETIATKMGWGISEHQKSELQKQTKALIGIDVFKDIAVRPKIQKFTAENVALIQTIPQQYFDQVERVVLEGIKTGERASTIAVNIEERFTVTKSRAKLIARDQVLKFNGDLNRTRQQALGVEKFVWRTVKDNRVREVHAERDGQVYEWANPPGDSGDAGDGEFPGDGINCRCFAEPVLDFSET